MVRHSHELAVRHVTLRRLKRIEDREDRRIRIARDALAQRLGWLALRPPGA
jgi:hypothetical protein